jgi:imidazolonepropionase-like amidohydrolase
MIPSGSEALLVLAGRLWDGSGAPARQDMGLVVRGGRVERVAPVADLVDWTGPRLAATGGTVMPGLMDLHVHLVSVLDPDEPNAIWADTAAGSRAQPLAMRNRILVDRRR